MSNWGIQVGLIDGDPILLASAFSEARESGQTMRPEQALRYSSQEEAQKHCDRLNGGTPILRPSARPINLDDLVAEYRDAESAENADRNCDRPGWDRSL